MPGLPLASQQISDIVEFLHFRVKEALSSAHAPGDYPLEKLLTGNAAQGKSYFEGAGGCAGRHSTTGDLAGVAKKYSLVLYVVRGMSYDISCHTSISISPPPLARK